MSSRETPPATAYYETLQQRLDIQPNTYQNCGRVVVALGARRYVSEGEQVESIFTDLRKPQPGKAWGTADLDVVNYGGRLGVRIADVLDYLGHPISVGLARQRPPRHLALVGGTQSPQPVEHLYMPPGPDADGTVLEASVSAQDYNLMAFNADTDGAQDIGHDTADVHAMIEAGLEHAAGKIPEVGRLAVEYTGLHLVHSVHQGRHV